MKMTAPSFTYSFHTIQVETVQDTTNLKASQGPRPTRLVGRSLLPGRGHALAAEEPVYTEYVAMHRLTEATATVAVHVALHVWTAPAFYSSLMFLCFFCPQPVIQMRARGVKCSTLCLRSPAVFCTAFDQGCSSLLWPVLLTCDHKARGSVN
jgi:hypothetical protein